MQNGENLQALHKNLEFIRFFSVLILLIHFYCVCFPLMIEVGLTLPIISKLLFSLTKGIFLLSGITIPKLTVLLLLLLSQIGEQGKKDNKLEFKPVFVTLCAGLLIYFLSYYLFLIPFSERVQYIVYIVFTTVGYLITMYGGARLSRLISVKMGKDPFNLLEESFPQEERCLENEYSVNLPAIYKLKGKVRKSWINIVNPFRALLVLGTPGSGKSFFVIRHVITQHIKKGFTCYLYDFKFPDLTLIAYNTALKNMDKYPVPPKLYVINFDDLSRSHRCNLLSPDTMHDITDATESSRTIMLALNREWLKKQGEFFTESPINFVTALFWFLKKYEGGRFCTLPHAIELAQVEYEKLFPVLSLEPEIDVLINVFISALTRGAAEQLEGQIASAKIGMARLVSPSLYYILSGNDFTLDINDPAAPKIVCVGNNPSKTSVYGAVLSLCTERMLKLVNRKGKLKSSLIFDEYPTLVADLTMHVSTARSNLSSTTIGLQDFSQVKKEYGRDQAEVIMNVCGNIISGQVLGDTSKLLSERLGKIMQERESLSINSNDTSISRSTQLESALQPARISNLSSGEFVGAVADDPKQRIPQKSFHCEIVNDFEAIKKEESEYQELPQIRTVTTEMIQSNYFQIKKDITDLIDREMAKIEGHGQSKEPKSKQKADPAGAESF
jgi:YWFCY protein/TraM recognition site of TraD and TraG